MWLNDITVDGTKYYISKSETTSIGESADKIEITPILMNYTKEDPYISYYLKGFEHKRILSGKVNLERSFIRTCRLELIRL